MTARVLRTLIALLGLAWLAVAGNAFGAPLASATAPSSVPYAYAYDAPGDARPVPVDVRASRVSPSALADSPDGVARGELRAAPVAFVAAETTAPRVLTTSEQRALRSLQSQVEAHTAKLDDYMASPDAYDNQGLLARAPSPQIRQRIIDGRIRHLQTEIKAFQDQITKIQGGG